jgi:micrococcal nuclease
LAKKKPRLSKAQSKHVVALQQEYKRRHRPVSGPSWRAAIALFLVVFLLGNSSGFLIARYVLDTAPPKAPSRVARAPESEHGPCRVKYVTGWDTFLLVTGEKIKMVGVTTTESVGSDAYVGKRALSVTRNLLEGKRVSLRRDTLSGDRDKSGRLLRYVFLEDGKDCNLLLVERGYARVNPQARFQKKDDYLKAQRKAVKDGRGMWDAEARKAWETAYAAKKAEMTARAREMEARRSREAVRRKRLAELAARGDGKFIGSVRGKTYHAKSCKRLPAKMNRIFFQSREEAEELGYRPHSCVKDRRE